MLTPDAKVNSRKVDRTVEHRFDAKTKGETMSYRKILIAVGAAVAALAVSAAAQQPPGMKAPNNSILIGLENAPVLLKNRVVAERQIALSHGWHFTPRLTAVSGRPLGTLAGTSMPPPSAAAGALRITAQGNAVLNAYLAQLSAQHIGWFLNNCSPNSSYCDWSAQGKVTPPDPNGQQCGDCWAWATTANIESAFLMSGWSIDLMSQQDIRSCSGAGNCSSGYAFNAISWDVTNKEATRAAYPYEGGTDEPCRNIAGKYQLLSVGWVAPSNPSAIPAPSVLKAALSKYGPLTIAIWADGALQDYGGPSAPSGEVFDANDNPVDPNSHAPSINHSILLVGWDDSKGAWKIKNSWGTGWGYGGYGWIKYGTNNVGTWASWAVAPKPLIVLSPVVWQEIAKLSQVISVYHPNVHPLMVQPVPGPGPGPSPMH